MFVIFGTLFISKNNNTTNKKQFRAFVKLLLCIALTTFYQIFNNLTHNHDLCIQQAPTCEYEDIIILLIITKLFR